MGPEKGIPVNHGNRSPIIIVDVSVVGISVIIRRVFIVIIIGEIIEIIVMVSIVVIIISLMRCVLSMEHSRNQESKSEC